MPTLGDEFTLLHYYNIEHRLQIRMEKKFVATYVTLKYILTNETDNCFDDCYLFLCNYHLLHTSINNERVSQSLYNK